MGKKRKLTTKSNSNASRGFDSKESKLGPINSYEDVADSEDEFLLNRDKISVGQDINRNDEDSQIGPSDDEVLGYSSDSEEEDYGKDYDAFPLKGQKGKSGTGQDIEASEDDEEQAEREEDEEGWGASKRDYYDADEVENEEEALEEEREARRLQQRRFKGMTEADFGFDESQWLEKDTQDEQMEDKQDGAVVTERLPELEITEATGPEERRDILRARYPEFEPLAREFIELQKVFEDLGYAATAAQSLSSKAHVRSGLNGASNLQQARPSTVVKYDALGMYLGSLSLYFALLTSTSEHGNGIALAMPASELREHPIMESLVKCREMWNRTKELSEDDQTQITDKMDNVVSGVAKQESRESRHGIVEQQLVIPPEKPKKMSKKDRALQSAEEQSQQRRAERVRKNEEDLAQLDALAKPTKRRRKETKIPVGEETVNGDDSDVGEQSHLTAQEAAEKAKRKKSLKFYTSQIAQKSQRRDQAGRDTGGDADVPYRERFRDRQAQLNAAAEKRGRGLDKKNRSSADLGGSSDSEDPNVAHAEDDADAATYYNTIRSKPKRAEQRAKRYGTNPNDDDNDGTMIYEADKLDPSGKRAISYAIEKNKGLTPKRKKEVRNPRVKKRNKYEDKQKKLRSVRQVYRGDEAGRGNYGGESTGIKSGLVRSRKL